MWYLGVYPLLIIWGLLLYKITDSHRLSEIKVPLPLAFLSSSLVVVRMEQIFSNRIVRKTYRKYK